MADKCAGVGSSGASGSQAGVTVVELLVYLVISVVIVASVYGLLIGQNRLYSKQQGLQDVRTTVRSSAAFLAWEMRQLSAEGGDIYSAGVNDLVIRSTRGSGIICAIDEANFRYGLIDAEGEFSATPDDSVLVYNVSHAASGDAWLVAGVSDVWMTGGGMPHCQWGDSATVATEMVIELTADSALIGVDGGAPIRLFRRVHYGIYSEGGRWWLGRKVGSDSIFEKLTGPLESPGDSGLVFSYDDRYGNATADLSQIDVVDISVRGESVGKVRLHDGALGVQEDSLTLRVHLRG